MKRLKSLLLLLVMMGSISVAEAKLISIGPHAAINNANFSIKGDDAAISNQLGYQVGLDMAINLPIISITPGILYSNNSFTTSCAATNYVECDVKSRNLSIPVIVGLSLFGPVKIEAGPVFVVNESNKAEASMSSLTLSGDVNSLRKSDSYLIGARATFSILTVYARYQQQFGTTSTVFGDMKYSSYSIGVGVRF